MGREGFFRRVSLRAMLCAVAVALLLAGVPSLHAQDEATARYVRGYRNLSAVTIPASAASAAWSLARPGTYSVFAAFLTSVAEYGMVLTGVRTDEISGSLRLAHVAAGAVALGGGYYGLVKKLRADDERKRRAREDAARVRLIPNLSPDGSAGLSLALRF
jgi:hypothetical protein